MDYRVCGWRVTSEVALPDLWPWDGDDRPPGLTIRSGATPDLADPVDRGPLIVVGRNRVVQLAIPGALRLQVTAGREIVVDPASIADWPAFLTGPVLGIVALQRGLLPLSAAAVTIGGRMVALVGPSAAGKSTLAAALVARGHRLAADAVAVIDLGALGGPLLLPSAPQLGLWPDSLAALGLVADPLPVERAGVLRRRLPVPNSGPEPTRLEHLYLLEPAPAPDREVPLPIDRPEAANRLGSMVSAGRSAARIAGPHALSDAVVRLAATVPATRLPIWPGLNRLAAAVARLEAEP
jgi:hypothetical protein